MVVQNQQEQGEGSAMPTDPYHTPTITQPLTSTQPKKTQNPRKPTRKNTKVPQPSSSFNNVADEAVHKELSDSLVRAATTTSSLEAEQDSGGGPRCQETMGDTIAQTRFENVYKLSNDPLLARGNTLQSGEDSLKLKELMELCTNLQQRVLDLEKTKTTQDNEITKLKKKVKKLEQEKRSTTRGLKRLHKVEIFDEYTLTGDEVFVEQEVVAKDVNLTVDEVTLAQALTSLKSEKPKVKVDVIEEPSVPVSAASTKVSTASTKVSAVSASTMVSAAITTTATIPTPRKGIDKGKGKMVEEPVKKVSKTDQLKRDEEEAKILQAEFDVEERLAREKDEANKELVEGKEKRAGVELEQEVAKKQKVDEDRDTSELQSLMDVIPDEEEVAIKVVPLGTKPPTIVDWKIHKEGKKIYFQIIRADGTKHGSTRPEEGYKRVLWGDLKGRIVGIKSFLMLFEVTAALIGVNDAQSNTKLLLLVEVKTAGEVTTVGIKLLLLQEVTTASGS
ncbi:hypothetical protein Tco_0473004 [Tanacetum coccineum]